MNPQEQEQLLRQCADAAIAEESQRHGFKASPHLGRLGDLLAKLLQMKGSFLTILANIQKIIDILNSNATFTEKLIAVAQLIFGGLNPPVIQLPE